MSKKILVAYASVSGSTGDVAAAISQVLAGDEVLVETKPVREVEQVRGYSAVVLGSSIRAGRWLPEAQAFLDTHYEAIKRVPVAFFTTCLTMVTDSEDSRRTVLAYLEPVLQSAPDIEPVGLGLFAGSLDPTRQLLARLHTELAPQGDYRDWAAIKRWAAGIKPLLLAGETEPDKTILMRDAVLSYSDMSGSDLTGVDLQGAELREIILSEARLQGANLEEADMIGAKLGQADLNEARMRKAGLNWADLNLANASGADLHEANLIGADLSRANLSEANLSRSILNGANLSKANLSEADLSGADLNWANLSSADLSGANLNGTSLGWADLSEANLSAAQLENARYNHYTVWPETFSPEEHGAVFFGLEPR